MTKTKQDTFQLEFLYMLKSPIIVPPTQVDFVTQEQKNQHQMESMLHQKEIFEQKQVSDYSAMLYVSFLSLEHPLTHEYVNIYEYLFSKFFDIEKILCKKAPVLEDLEKQELAKLKSWIFKKQIEHLKERLK